MQLTTRVNVMVYLGTVAGALLAIGALLRYAVVKPLVRWMAKQLRVPVRQVAAEVGASAESEEDGPTLKDMIIAYGFRLSAVEQRLADHVRDHA